MKDLISLRPSFGLLVSPCMTNHALRSSQVLVIRLRDSMIKMGEELSRAVKAEAQQRENSQYYQQRLEELKAEMQELAQREEEASRRCMELVSPCPGGLLCVRAFRLEQKLPFRG